MERNENIRRLLLMGGFLVVNLSVLVNAYLMYNQTLHQSATAQAVQAAVAELKTSNARPALSADDLKALTATLETQNGLLRDQLAQARELTRAAELSWTQLLLDTRPVPGCAAPGEPAQPRQPPCPPAASPAVRAQALALLMAARARTPEAERGALRLDGLNVSGASFAGAELSGASLSGAQLPQADLSGAKLAGADLSGAELFRASAAKLGAPKGNLQRLYADLADLEGADLSGAQLAQASLRGAALKDAKLAGADLSGADLAGADLTGADLTGANLSGANLAQLRPTPRDGARPDRLKALFQALQANPAALGGAKLDGATCDALTRLPPGARCDGGAIAAP